ncbi:MAG: hypothetical protein ACLQBX_09285 [Candidatus Limnocylindrales bacterium]
MTRLDAGNGYFRRWLTTELGAIDAFSATRPRWQAMGRGSVTRITSSR